MVVAKSNIDFVFVWYSTPSSFMSNFYTPSQSSFTLKSKRLIVPIVSVANLGQLAADLLICSLGLERKGFLDDALLIPAVGARDLEENDGNGQAGELRGGISTPLEGSLNISRS